MKSLRYILERIALYEVKSLKKLMAIGGTLGFQL